MSETARPMTDPAREMVELLTMIAGGNPHQAGADLLATLFGVEPWSQDFYRIVVVILDRLDELRGLVAMLPLDEDFRLEMVAHVEDIALAFKPNAFQASWHQFGLDKIGPKNLQPLKGIAGMVRQLVSYPKLSDEESATLVEDVTVLLTWLRDHQLAEHDFIRQALIEGLEHLVFRLERLRWLGWGYALEALKEVIAAYMLLERQGVDVNVNPDAAAVLSKVAAVIRTVYEKVEKAKGVAETGDFILRAYGAAAAVQAVLPTIRGLLT